MSGLRRSSARLPCRRLTAPRRRDWLGDMEFAKLQLRILSAAEAVQAPKLHSDMPPEQQAIMLSAGGPGNKHVRDGRAQITNRTGTECAVEDGHGVTARCNAGCRPALHVCSAERQ